MDSGKDSRDGTDVVIVGAGAAGLAAAIFLKRASPAAQVTLVDGAKKPGAKILVSGGGRCNVTNRLVTEHDFWGARRTIVRQVLRAFSAEDTVEFFGDLGVALHEEAGGKLFPDSNRARDVLDALVGAAHGCGVDLRAGVRVRSLTPKGRGFAVETSGGILEAARVVLATGGRSLPKTGSDGAGYELARSFGHRIVATTPALAPLTLDPDTPYSVHGALSGVAIDGEISIWIDGALATRLCGALLWTHFGVSGPLVLNCSRHWARAQIDGCGVRLTLNYHPGESFEQVDARWTVAGRDRPRTTVRAYAAEALPDAVARAVLQALHIAVDLPLTDLTRGDRRRLVHALTEWPLPVTGTRGYNFAEATAGGVPLEEVDTRTMESRLRPGLFFAGEILDVDGRIGGFNFQWAWSTAWIAAQALASANARVG
jgi:predicted Rossmann fold flavoprotein